jgi:hypothetical protein
MISLLTRLHCKQESWNQVCENTRPNCGYLHKVTQIWCFYQDSRCVGSYKEIKFKGGCWKEIIFWLWKIEEPVYRLRTSWPTRLSWIGWPV